MANPKDGKNGDPQRKQPLSSSAAAWVRERILSKELPAGTTVRPEDVGHTLGISQTPAREALQSLRTEGFLESQPGVGFVVAPLSSKDIIDIFAAHALIAGEIAFRAVNNATPRDINELEATHLELQAAEFRGDLVRSEERNHSFHRQITQLADSRKLAHILGIVARYVPRSFYGHVEGWNEASSQDHHAIIAAFRNKDAEAARIAMSEHMEHAGRLLAESFE